MEDLREHLRKLLDPDKMVRFEAMLKINEIITEASLPREIQKFISKELVNSPYYSHVLYSTTTS